MPAKKGTHKAARKAGDGTFTTLKYAKAHPKTTVVETVKNPSKQKKKGK